MLCPRKKRNKGGDKDEKCFSSIEKKYNDVCPGPGVSFLYLDDKGTNVYGAELQRADHTECLCVYSGNRYADVYADRW
jgi:hypothetical protein